MLGNQLCSCVLWEPTVRAMIKDGITESAGRTLQPRAPRCPWGRGRGGPCGCAGVPFCRAARRQILQRYPRTGLPGAARLIVRRLRGGRSTDGSN